MLEQKKAEDFGITEDDVSEIRQDINKFRFELLDILRKNKFDIGKIRSVGGCYGGRRAKQMERRIMKGFTLEIYDLLKDSLDKQDKNKSVDIFQVMAEAMHKTSKNSQQPAVGYVPSSDYSPATVVAANKFKRFLGKHLKQEEKSANNNVPQYGSNTAPCSPHRRKLKQARQSDLSSSLDVGEADNNEAVSSDIVTDEDNLINGRHKLRNDIHNTSLEHRDKSDRTSLSCSRLTTSRTKRNVTGGWIWD